MPLAILPFSTQFILKLSLCIGILVFPSLSLAQSSTEAVEEEKTTAEQMLFKRQQLDQTLWGPEVLAQKYERRFTRLWDDLLNQQDRLAILGNFPFQTLQLGKKVSSKKLDLDIQQTHYASGGDKLTPAQWQQILERFKFGGYRIEQSEWHHSSFQPPKNGMAAKSDVSFVIHTAKSKPIHRVIIRGMLKVEWSSRPDDKGDPVPDMIALDNLEVLERQSQPVFQEVFTVRGTGKRPRVLPLHVYDLNGDGLSEIILGGQNMLIWNRGGGKFEVDQLLPGDHSLFDAAILADFTGDGHVDYVAVDSKGYPLLFEGNAEGKFSKPGYKVADTHFKLPKSFTAGDVDGDGDLDLFIANYKYAYRQGQMPTPYFDANDGYPAYLLRNDGKGKFSDITAQAGLAAKRYRRTYSSSLVDIDHDKDMDLIVVSDYAGLDMYLNDGKGKFTDVSNTFGKDRHFFGMGHTFADYDMDGLMDMYIIGMSSTTAKRLDRLGLDRKDMPEFNAMRSKMGFGNRIFLRKGKEFVLAPFNKQVARTGWSWGASSFDFDNDGDKDIFVANGHYSGKSTQDYCTTFWRHDIYDVGSAPNKERDKAFQFVSKSLRQADISWNGYEHKALLMNDNGKSFDNISYLMGSSFEYDGRAVVTDDLDADGRMDLLVVEFKTEGLDRNKYILHVYKNTLEQAGNWIGVRLPTHSPGFSPIGAEVIVRSRKSDVTVPMDPVNTQTSRVVTGDSFSSQHSSTLHFGLGRATEVESIEVRWSNGVVRKLSAPAIGRYHRVDPLVNPAKDNVSGK